MDDDFPIFGTILVVILLVAMSVFLSFQADTLHNQRNSLVQQTCDYAEVANTDTVTELCTKYQQQTNTTYLKDNTGASRVERNN